MRILYVITGLGVGGAERQVVDLADRMSASGDEVRIVYLTGAASVVPTDKRIGVTGFGIQRNATGLWRAARGLKRELAAFRPDVVHSHMVHANLLTRLVRPGSPLPRLICTAHNTDEGGRVRMWLYRLTDGLADVTTNVSQEAVEAFEVKGAAPPGRLLAVPNGVDVDRFRAEVPGRGRELVRKGLTGQDSILLIVAIGRLATQKDYPNLLNAVARLRGFEAPVHLAIAGDGPLRESMEKMSADLGVRDRVHFLGVRSDVPALIDAADAFVLPSAWEGFGLVVGEAMSCGKVVVATDCGGVRELLGDCGILVQPRDPVALAQALERALAMPHAEAVALGARARQRIVDRFSLAAVAGYWQEIYHGQIPAALATPARARQVIRP